MRSVNGLKTCLLAAAIASLCVIGCGGTAPQAETTPESGLAPESSSEASGTSKPGAPGSSTSEPATRQPAAAGQTAAVLRLASTTSTRDAGLSDVLLPMFEEQESCRVDLIAVGTGAALKLGRTADADAVLVHSRPAEKVFMEAGHGIRHEPVMHNFFIIVGPADDPAGIKESSEPASALQKIAAGKHRFVSRGDDSGTHKRELSLWKKAGGRPAWDDYVETGQGMGASLTIADELNAYLLIDEATWIRQGADTRLEPLITGALELKNPYAVMVVDPEKHPAVNAELADRFADFLISPETQRVIAEYEIRGRQLFHPDRL